MAVAFDALGTAVTSTSSANASWTHTSGSGGGTVLVFICVGFSPTASSGGATGSYSSVTYNGNAMTLLAARAANDGSGNGGACFLYGITGQSSGGSVTVSASSFSAPSNAVVADFLAWSLSFTGAGALGTAVSQPTTGVGSQTSGSVTVATTSSSSLVFAGFGDGTGGQSITAGTQRFLKNLNSATAVGNGCGATAPGTGGNVTISASWTSDWWAGIGVEVKPSSTLVSASDASAAAADAGELVSATVSDLNNGANSADGGEAVTASLSDSDSGHGADAGELVARQDFSLGQALPSPAWLNRFRRPPGIRSVPVAPPSQAADADAAAVLDGGETVLDVSRFTGGSVAQAPPSWRAAYRHGQPHPAVPVFMPLGSMTVTASLATAFQGGSLLQVWVLDGATEAGGAADAEVIGDAPGTGTLTPAFTGSFVGWAVFNDGDIGPLSADSAAASNVLDVNIPGTSPPVGAAGHYTGTVTAGTPLSYGLANGATGDQFVLCAYEVPPLTGGVPPSLSAVTPAGVTDSTMLASLTSQPFSPSPGQVIVVAYATNNAGSVFDTASYSISDSFQLAWQRRAVANTPGNWLAVIWTATVPNARVHAGDDALGTDYETASTWSGQSRVPDATGAAVDSESVTATVVQSDSCTAADGPDPAVFAQSESDVAAVAESDPVTAGITGLAGEAGTGTDAAVIIAADGDSGTGSDAGELVAAALSDTDPATGTDAAVVGVADSDAGAGADGAESVARQDFSLGKSSLPFAWRARFQPRVRPSVVPFTSVTFLVSDPVPDTALGEDAEIDNPFPVDTAETCRGTDAGEVFFPADADAGTGTDVTFEFEFCTGADLELTAWPSSADASLAFDPERGLFAITDADASAAAADGAESVAASVAKSDADASGAAADSQSVPNAALGDADASASVDNREFIPEDADASAAAADGGEALAGGFSDAEHSVAFDVESRVFGPNAAPSDADSGHGTDGGELPDVYAFVPLFRWGGGSFRLRPGREER